MNLKLITEHKICLCDMSMKNKTQDCIKASISNRKKTMNNMKEDTGIQDYMFVANIQRD